LAYKIELTDLALDELKAIRVFDRRRIVDEIGNQLAHQPTIVTRHRKCLTPPVSDFAHVLPIWELRVGDYRVFYDVDEAEQAVDVRAVRLKEAGRTTGEVLNERDNA
jgi:mRNA-degrading endonuclease RelE of RelBE toxin-antitoxin system